MAILPLSQTSCRREWSPFGRAASRAGSSEGHDPATHLLDSFPTEVVYLVCEALDDQDLFTLSFVCRRLHNLALPVYLSRHGVAAHEGELVLGSVLSENAVKALRAALFRPHLRRLVCAFDLVDLPAAPARRAVITSGTSCSRVSEHPLAKLRWLLEHVHDVREVHLQLGNFTQKTRADRHLQVSAEGAHFGDRSPDVDFLEAIEEFGKGWEWLLDDVLCKGACRSLTIQVVSHHRPISVQDVEEALINNYYGVNSFRRLKLGYSWLMAPSRWLGFQVPKLEAFQVHSEVLFHPVLCHWTIRTLNLSSLTSLSFDQLHHLSPQTWSLLLPCIVTPNLAKLSISLCSILPEDLYRFFSRHPNLAELRLGFNLLPPDPKIALPKNAFPKLRSLTGPAEHLVHFLSFPSNPIPTLESVCVLYRTRRGSHFTMDAINHDLAPICLRLRSLKEVRLRVSFESGAVHGLVSADSNNHSRHRGLGVHDLHFDQDDPDDELTHTTHLNPPISFTSSCVTDLQFKVNLFVLPPSLVITLPKWLLMFGKLKYFELVTLSANVSGPGLGGDPFELDSHREVFLRSVARSCPTVRRIWVNGKEEEVPTGRAVVNLLL